ncbi:Crp/Fnr family transcriptional regulator [Croceitalea rosinachiae]|uniref:Crp/Fnr family transcriptional regulator n=1 Tax=Croceitalea rosinachiae TaxID=3075596 RepID=A0ABU3A7V0_9FLAO|nr:Crp/Fnr family transcriptional regulator [Croceitalea sp. F388]MDT0605958.1 Crp/Fnr family transcriptional regulator [Croceitalea sp. F388]
MRFQIFISLLRKSKFLTFEKGSNLIKIGAREPHLFFIRKGLVRCFFVDEKGDEITFQLFPENRIVSNFHTIMFNKPSKFEYQTLERTKVYTIDFKTYQAFILKNPKLLEANREFLFKRNFEKVYNRIESFVLLAPEERYIKYCKDYPGIVNRAPDRYIASVLGITPVSLSRIRKRIVSKK